MLVVQGKYLRNAGVARLAYGTTESPIAGGESLAELLREKERSSAKHSRSGLVSLQVMPAVDMCAALSPPSGYPTRQW